MTDLDANGEHEALLEFLYQIPIGVAHLLPDGELGMANPTAVQLTQQIAPHTLNLFTMLARHAPEIELLVRSFDAERGVIFEDYRVDFGHRNPTAAHALVVAFTIIRLGRERTMVVMNDVSRSEAAARRAREAERRLRAVSEGVRDYAVFSLDAQGTIRDWNRSAERIFAFDSEAVLDRPLTFLAKEGSLDLTRLLEQARRVGWAIGEGWWRRREESQFPGTAALGALHDERGSLEGFTCIVRDQSNVLVERPGGPTGDLDPETSALKAAPFARVVGQVFDEWREEGGAVALVLMELDHLERLRAKEGEEPALDVIRMAVGVVRDHARASDTLVRHGPAQLLVLMRDTELVVARTVAERVRADVEGRILETEAALLKVTASFGVVAIDPADGSFTEAVERCERALAEARARGHNQVVVGHPRRARSSDESAA